MSALFNRRQLIAAAIISPLARSASANRVRLGGPIFLKTEDWREQAREHRRLGYSAAYCPSGLKAGDPAIAKVKDAFAAEDVIIAEVGAWVNMLDRDEAKRRSNMEYVQERLSLADEVGALCCVDIGGSYDPNLWDGPDPKNLTRAYFDATVENCRRLIDAVKPTRTKFSIEMMGWSLPNTPDAYSDLIKAVDRPAFGAHVDICNIVESPQVYYHNGDLTNEVFRKLGPWIISCHAKDLGPRSTHLAETIPGRGGIDYRAYLAAIASLGRETPLMLEHLKTGEEYTEGRSYIQKVARDSHIPLA